MRMQPLAKKFFPLLLITLFFGVQHAALAATFLLQPSRLSLKPDEEFTVDLAVTARESVNAIEPWLIYPKALLEVVRVERDNSVFTMWMREAEFDNTSGLLTFVAGLPHPGYVGNRGHVVRIVFRARADGRVQLSFDPRSQALLHDGMGTPDEFLGEELALTVLPKETNTLEKPGMNLLTLLFVIPILYAIKHTGVMDKLKRRYAATPEEATAESDTQEPPSV